MAEFVNPGAVVPPDILGSYLRGQLGGLQVQGAQQGLQQGQQALTQGGLQIDQLRLALQKQGIFNQMLQSYQNRYAGAPAGSAPAGAQGAPGSSGGIQTGPQGQVMAPTQASGSYNGSYASGSDALSALADPRRIADNAELGSYSAMMSGGDPNKPIADAQALMEARRKDMQETTKIQLMPHADDAKAFLTSPHPEQMLSANPSFMAMWKKYAPQMHINPNDPAQMTPYNVRAAGVMSYNENIAARSMGTIEPLPMPEQFQNVNLGQGEIGQIDPVTGKKSGSLVERQTPSYTLQPKTDLATGQTTMVPVQTGGYGMGGVSPVTGQPTGAATGQPAGFNKGYDKPTDPELKAAMFGSEMRPALQKLQSMESQGFNLSPKSRALLIHAATSEDSGAISQLLGQEALAHGMSQKEQTYISALMPLLQAAGHDQSGARLTTGQIRQNVESLIPIDTSNKDALEQVNKNRQGFYTGLLTQAGSAAQLPQYKGTLGADLKTAQNVGANNTKTIGGKTYVHLGNGRWREQ